MTNTVYYDKFLHEKNCITQHTNEYINRSKKIITCYAHAYTRRTHCRTINVRLRITWRSREFAGRIYCTPEPVTAEPFTSSADVLSRRLADDEGLVVYGAAPDTLDQPLSKERIAAQESAVVDSLILSSNKETAQREAAESYVQSPERALLLQGALDQAGRKILDLSESGEAGYFDFYNGERDTWRSETDDIEGWGWLQHNPQYGDSERQYAVFVYMNADGTINKDLGVHGIKVSGVDGSFATIDAPDRTALDGIATGDYERVFETTYTRGERTPDGKEFSAAGVMPGSVPVEALTLTDNAAVALVDTVE